MMEIIGKVPKWQLGKPSRRDWHTIGLGVRTEMLTRTRSGLDVNRQPFAPYSAQTQEYKNSIKTSRGDSGAVDLIDTGQMLRSMAVQSDAVSSEIYFSDGNRAAIAYKHQKGIGVPKREHFGLNDSDAKRWMLKVAEMYTRATQRVNR